MASKKPSKASKKPATRSTSARTASPSPGLTSASASGSPSPPTAAADPAPGAVVRLGSKGTEVIRLQQALKDAGFLTGTVDGDFGGGTLAALRGFQQARRLSVTGVADAATWGALFRGEAAPTRPAIASKPLVQRCLALTGAFETSKGPPDCFAGVTGDFDGQGLSFGALQWNFGQGTLQPMIIEMAEAHRAVFDGVFGEQGAALLEAVKGPKPKALAFARSIQHPVKKALFEPWLGYFRALGRTEQFQGIQAGRAQTIFDQALATAAQYECGSERAAALFFDIRVQNGSIGTETRSAILAAFRRLPRVLSPEAAEIERLKIVAVKRAEAARPEYVKDVKTRKLCCAEGAGIVHGVAYNLESQFGIGMKTRQS